MSQAKNSSPIGPLHQEAIQAMREAAWDVIQEHKRTGVPLVQWRDGKVVHVPPEEAEAEYLAAKADDGTAAPGQNGA